VDGKVYATMEDTVKRLEINPVFRNLSKNPNDLKMDKVIVRRRPVKNVSLRMLGDGTLRVTAPYGVDIEKVLCSHEKWIEAKRALIRGLAIGHEGKQHSFLLDGSYWHLVLGDRCDFVRDVKEVTYSSPKALKHALVEWLREDITERVDRNAQNMAVTFGRVSIRMQRTRWGSCSGRGNLNFNLRLIAVPGWLREYVIVHELLHLKEPSHSSKYWTIVEDYCPWYVKAEEALKRYWVVIEHNEIWKTINRI
jgi:predicted metal-dependent hydrolase